MGFWIMMIAGIVGIVVYCLWSGKAGMQKEYRDNAEGLTDLLRYSTPISDGVLLGKGGELIAGFFYRGTDTESATNAELESIAARLNSAMTRFGSGWMLHIDAIRGSAIGYPALGDFTSPVTRLMDEERRVQYNQEAGHYESRYALVLTYLPPSRLESKAKAMMYDESDDVSVTKRTVHDDVLQKFERTINETQAQLGTIFETISRMRCHEVVNEIDGSTVIVDDLLGYLHYCVTGISQNILAPKAGVYADSIIASQDFTGGNHPKIGAKHIRAISIEGFPSASVPGILGALNMLPISYRWSSRFIFLESEEGKNILDRYRKRWKQKVRGLKDQMMNTNTGTVDADSLGMMVDAESAMSEASSGLVRFGHYTSVVLLMDEDRDAIEESVTECLTLIRNLGFTARKEDVNAVEAYLGSLPGHGYENVRRPILHSLNLVHLIPTTAAWPGPVRNACPFYPKNSPPLFYAASSGNAPFRVSLHVGDVGHTLILGPTGAGKSTLLEFIQAQHFRYPSAKVFKFEKGYSSFVLCNATGGTYYDIGGENQQYSFCPLARIDKPTERIWAEGYIETLLALQGFKVLSEHRNLIRDALILVGKSAPDRRSMTDFVASIMHPGIQAALEPYTLGGDNGMLDATEDNMRFGRYQVFEMEHLMNMGEKHVVPVLLYLFRCIERQLDGSPVLLILDEAWLMLNNPLFQDKIKEWLKVMRKANCSVVFATQSISDVGNSPIRDVIYESCLTKFLLPNTEARTNEGCFQQYKLIGLNDRQIDMLSHATPKRDYYYMSSMGRRMFRLGLGAVNLAFVGASGKEDVALARQLMGQYGERWPVEWLKVNARSRPWGKGLDSWAFELDKSYRRAA